MKKNKIIKIFGLISLFLFISSIFTFAYYTNTNKYFIDSRKDDGFSGLGLERESNEFIEDGCGVGTILDTLTGICWLKNMNTFGTRNWATALTDCSNLDYATNTNWELPTRDELTTLVDEIGLMDSTCTTLTNFNFTNCQNNLFYWSQDVYQGNTANAWIIRFANGYSGNSAKTTSYYVTCVIRDY